MGFDITFHPLSLEDVQHFVVDVLDDPGMAMARAGEATDDLQKRDLLAAIYERMAEVEVAVRDGLDSFPTLALGIAAVAGFRQPYWYARGAALSFLAEDEPKLGGLLVSLTSLAPQRWRGLADPHPGRIADNFSGGGFILPGKVILLKRLLLAEEAEEMFGEVFSEEALEALESAVDHALRSGSGLMEAADLVIPSEDEAFTDLDNLRAPWLSEEGRERAADEDDDED